MASLDRVPLRRNRTFTLIWAGQTNTLTHLSLHALFRETLAGARLILSSAPQRLLKLAGTPLYLTSGAIELLLATLTQQSLHLPAAAAGVIFGAAGIGGLIGSVLAPRLFDHGWRRSLSGAAVLAAIGAGGLAVASHLATLPGFLLAFAANLLLSLRYIQTACRP